MATYHIPEDLYDLLDALNDCDGYSSAITISADISPLLKEMGWASQNARGSYGGTQALSDALKNGYEDAENALITYADANNHTVEQYHL